MLGRGSALGNIGPCHGVTRVTGTRGHIISLGVTIRGRRNYVSTAEPESLVASDQGPGTLVYTGHITCRATWSRPGC